MLGTYLLRMDGLELGGEPVAGGGAARPGMRCASRGDKRTPLRALAEDGGGFDVVLEAAGDAQVMLDALGLLRRNGVACLLGIDGRPQDVTLDGRVLGVDAILQNRALFGSVNANASTGTRPSRTSTPRVSAGPRRSRRSSACACRSTASRMRCTTGG